MLCESNYCIIEMFSINNKQKSTIPFHTHAEADFKVISVPSIVKNVLIFRVF